MLTRVTLMLVLAAACVANTGCVCTSCFSSAGGNCTGTFCGDSCPSCGMAEASCSCPEVAGCGLPEASCSCPDASCGLPEASCECPEVVSCGLPEASCCCPEDASCGLPTGGCDTCTTGVGCGSPVVGNCRFLQRIYNAIHGGSVYNSGRSSEAYWSEWHNDPPSGCPSCGPHARAGGRRKYQNVSSRLSKRNIDFGEELRFAEEESGTSFR